MLEQSWPEIRKAREDLPPFLRDTTLAVRLRMHYCHVQTVTPMEREAWAAGGWVNYQSGWLLNGFQIGGTYYGSGPVYGPANKDGSLLLAPGQQGYSVLGEAFAALRYEKYALLKGYRQIVQQPFINRLDNRMTPNTFEGVTLAGEIGPVEYFGGYLTQIKLRNADQFVPMSAAAGAPTSNHGVGLLDATFKPLPELVVKIAEQYGVNTFNTVFGQVEHRWPIGHDLHLQLGVQLIDQRAVGHALVATTRVSKWVTRHASARVAVTYQGLTVKGSAGVTASGNKIQSPWGIYPGYLQTIGTQQPFNNANEKALGLGVVYDFSKVALPGLTVFSFIGRGVDSINPVTGAHLPNEMEYDLVLDYQPPEMKGLWFRFMSGLFAPDDAARLGYQVRFVTNWDVPLL